MTTTGRPAGGLDDDSRPRRTATAETRREGDLVSVRVRGERSWHQLNPTAGALWELCDGATALREMFTAAEEAFDASPEVIRAEIVTALGDLRSAGLLVILD